LDGGVDAVECSARETFVTIVEVLARSSNWASMNSTKFELRAGLSFESRWTDAEEIVPSNGTVSSVNTRIAPAAVVRYDAFQDVVTPLDCAQRIR